jgi:hypothetical protein
MKLNHISTLLLFLLVFAFSGYSQVEDEEVPMFSFSSTRSIGGKATLDFGQVKKDAKILKFEIPNNSKADVKIDKISIPEGVGVIVLNEVIKAGSKGEIVVIINPEYMKSGTFNKDLTITTVSVDGKGVTITKTGSVKLTGQVL